MDPPLQNLWLNLRLNCICSARTWRDIARLVTVATSCLFHCEIYAQSPGPNTGVGDAHPNATASASPTAATTGYPAAKAKPTISPNKKQFNEITIPQITAIEQQRAARSGINKKISSALRIAVQKGTTGHVLREAPSVQAKLAFSLAQKTMVDLDAKVSDALLDSIRGMGGQIIDTFQEYNSIRCEIPISAIPKLAALPDVKFIRPAALVKHNASSTRSEGDLTHSADQARANFKVDGSGVKVGVISDNVDRGYLDRAIKQGRFKKGVTIVENGTGNSEGLAMLEIINDLAPGAELYFASAGNNPLQMPGSIRTLQEHGCRIIVDDVSIDTEPPFQDGPVSRAVAQVCKAGVLYFSCSTNSGNEDDGTSSTWEGDFADGGPIPAAIKTAKGRLHAFKRGITLNRIEGAGSQLSADLFWNDPLGRSSNQYDLFEVDQNYNVIDYGTDTMDGREDPHQSLTGISPGNYIVIVRASKAAPRFLHLSIGGGRLRFATSGCVRGHNASSADDAFCVAATPASPPGPFPSPFNTLNRVESFSSDGPRRIFFNADGSAITPRRFDSGGGAVIYKPDLTAADRVSTDVDGFSQFSGTSAAAPHAAAIAALILSYKPNATSAEVRSALKASCIKIMGDGWNRNAGDGIIMAFRALQGL